MYYSAKVAATTCSVIIQSAGIMFFRTMYVIDVAWQTIAVNKEIKINDLIPLTTHPS